MSDNPQSAWKYTSKSRDIHYPDAKLDNVRNAL